MQLPLSLQSNIAGSSDKVVRLMHQLSPVFCHAFLSGFRAVRRDGLFHQYARCMVPLSLVSLNLQEHFGVRIVF